MPSSQSYTTTSELQRDQVTRDVAPLLADGHSREFMALWDTGEIKSYSTNNVENVLAFIDKAHLSGAVGIFGGVNPIDFSTATAGYQRPSRNHVIHREALFFDDDVVAAKREKRASTSDERYLSHKAGMHIFTILERYGWAGKAQRMGSSGNGSALLLRLDNLPVDAHHNAVIAAALDSIATEIAERFPGIELDVGAGKDPVRVRRISGTRNRKYGGDSECRLTYHDDSEILPFEILERIAGDTRQRSQHFTSNGTTGSESPRRSGTIEPTDDEARRIVEVCRPHRHDGNRHDTALWIAGWMAWTGITRKSAVDIMAKIASNDTDAGDRIDGVHDTYDRYEVGDAVRYKDLPTPLVADLQQIAQAIKARVRPQRSESGVAVYAKTDTGNAERLVARFGDQIKYNYGRKVWYHWTGTHWAEDNSGMLDRLAKATVRSIPEEAAGLEGDQYTSIMKWAISSESSGKRAAMIELAQSEDGIPIQPDELDRDPWLLNVANGTLDLRTGDLREHRREDMITRCLSTPYDPQAECPVFLSFLDRIFASDREVIEYVQRMVGYSLTGSTREQIIMISYGGGANGKSTLLGVLTTLLEDYATQADTDSFMERKGDRVREDIAALEGARFVAASETADGRRLSEAFVKKATGGERLRARRLFENGYTFDPQFKIWLSTNHRPTIIGTDHAIWRRIRLIPFTVTIPKEEQDRKLPEKLQAELPGILAWAVEGCRRWIDEGEMPPPAVLQATERYRRDMDALGDWFEDRCALKEGAKTPTKELYQDYVQYCGRAGEEPLTQRTFGIRLTDRGIGEARSKSTRFRTGIMLKDSTTPQQETLHTPQGDGMTDVTQETVTSRESVFSREDAETSVTSVIVSPLDANGVEEWLLGQLSEGPKPITDVQKAARAEEIDSERLNDARLALGVRTKIIGPQWCWVLPDAHEGQVAS